MARTTAPVTLPRIVITFCTQCRWLLRAAYFAQELLSTFGTSIGEVALVPATGGIFNVTLSFAQSTESSDVEEEEKARVQTVLLWDRKSEGGFPETKVLKQRVRDHIEPKKDLGHSDVGGKKSKQPAAVGETTTTTESKLEDCATCP